MQAARHFQPERIDLIGNRFLAADESFLLRKNVHEPLEKRILVRLRAHLSNGLHNLNGIFCVFLIDRLLVLKGGLQAARIAPKKRRLTGEKRGPKNQKADNGKMEAFHRNSCQGYQIEVGITTRAANA